MLLIANWKMNPSSLKSALDLAREIDSKVLSSSNFKVAIAPPLVYLAPLSQTLKKASLCAQDMFYEEKGAFTGEVSPLQLKDLKVKYVILGHSERRKFLKETDELVNLKVKSALKHNLVPVFCIGEELEEREKGKTEEKLSFQLKEGLKDIFEISELFIAYEPVWAIGTGRACSFEEAKRVKDFILSFLKREKGDDFARKVKVLYGGSVNSKNAKDFINISQVEGFLVGKASLNLKEFSKIILTCAKFSRS